MQDDDAESRLERHALVVAVWLAAGAVAALLLLPGLGGAGIAWLAGGFAALLAGFAGHVLVNAILGTSFTPREVALALVLSLAALLALVLATLAVDGFARTLFLPLLAGAAALAAAVVFYLVTRHGPRRAFEVFDVIRDNNPRAASQLPHRGGRK
ncbi:MAG: hypothetical protein LBE86_01145 [Gemmobacter sp.]|jgi:hypothetical protein|nr:hypothetical protein [Gemmobacter sp.]